MIRFAIWTAVSSEPQAAPEKDSLTDQEAKCRASALAKGWTESAGPFVVSGQSRTRWVNLRDAEREIDPLGQMLNSAQRGDFDLLMLYDYNRLRDLLDPVAKTLASYGVQIYSVSQPVEPQPPDQFNPYSSDSESMMRGMSQIISRAQISDLRRKFRFGMLARVTKKGLPAFRPPFGYHKPPGRELDPGAIPIPDPAKADIVIRIKDWYLAGLSLWQIAHRLTDLGVPTPSGKSRWTDVITRHIMTNRFYCGEIVFGSERLIHDPRTGSAKLVKNPSSRVLVSTGAHAPLWDSATQLRIDDEFKRRGRSYTGQRTHRLSNLLYCGVCDVRVHVGYSAGEVYSGPTDDSRMWHCSSVREHVNVFDRDLLPRVIESLMDALRHVDDVQLPTPEDRRPLLSGATVDLRSRRDRLTEAYLAGAMALPEYQKRASDLEARLVDLEKELSDSDKAETRQQESHTALHDLAALLDAVPDYLLHAPEQEVNNQLRSLLDRIVITPFAVRLVFR
jgi:DNA invertase Pin-like site-specific DNA recombinase